MRTADANYPEHIIKLLGIGKKRNGSAPPHTLLSTDYEREKARQQIRETVEKARQLLSKRIGLVLSLEGKEVVVGENGSQDRVNLDFEAVYSGVDQEGNLFVSSSDSAVPDGVTLLFMARKNNGWKTEVIPMPNLNTPYFKGLASVEDSCAETENTVLEKNGYWKG